MAQYDGVTAENVALGLRAIRAPGWRWMDGMLRPTARGGTGRGGWVLSGGRSLWTGACDYVIPDLADPATLGCLAVLSGVPYAPADSTCADRMVQAMEVANG